MGVDMRTEASLDTYETPAWLVAEVKAFFGGGIALDPCTSDRNPTGAGAYYANNESSGNGLTHSWEYWYNAYVNSPYGRALKDWTAKCIRESTYNDVEIIQLAPARPATRWFLDMAMGSDELGVFKKRLSFTLNGKPVTDRKGKPCTGQFDSALAYYGPRGDAFRKHFAPYLTYWKLIA
jgi:hypothetical protein